MTEGENASKGYFKDIERGLIRKPDIKTYTLYSVTIDSFSACQSRYMEQAIWSSEKGEYDLDARGANSLR